MDDWTFITGTLAMFAFWVWLAYFAMVLWDKRFTSKGEVYKWEWSFGRWLTCVLFHRRFYKRIQRRVYSGGSWAEDCFCERCAREWSNFHIGV